MSSLPQTTFRTRPLLDKKKEHLFLGERVDWGDSLKQGGRKRDGHVGDERDFGCPLGLGDSSAGSENSIPLTPVRPESGVVLDGYIPDKEGQWGWSTSEAFGIPILEQNSVDEPVDDVDRAEDDASRTADLMIHVPEAVMLYGEHQEDTTWAQKQDVFRGSRHLSGGVTDATRQFLQIIKTTRIEVVEEEKPVGWEEMEIGFDIKRIWAERSRNSRG